VSTEKEDDGEDESHGHKRKRKKSKSPMQEDTGIFSLSIKNVKQFLNITQIWSFIVTHTNDSSPKRPKSESEGKARKYSMSLFFNFYSSFYLNL